MTKLAANLSMMFTEVDFLDRFAAAAEAGFGHDRSEGHAAHNAVAPGEVLGAGTDAQRMLGDDCSVLGDLIRQPGVLSRIHHVEPASHYADGPLTGLEGRPVCHRVDPSCQITMPERARSDVSR